MTACHSAHCFVDAPACTDLGRSCFSCVCVCNLLPADERMHTLNPHVRNAVSTRPTCVRRARAAWSLVGVLFGVLPSCPTLCISHQEQVAVEFAWVPSQRTIVPCTSMHTNSFAPPHSQHPARPSRVPLTSPHTRQTVAIKRARRVCLADPQLSHASLLQRRHGINKPLLQTSWRHFPRIASHRIASHRIASHRIASHRIASHRIASHRIASHRIASHPTPSHPHRIA
jgi:hypothetical protein